MLQNKQKIPKFEIWYFLDISLSTFRYFPNFFFFNFSFFITIFFCHDVVLGVAKYYQGSTIRSVTVGTELLLKDKKKLLETLSKDEHLRSLKQFQKSTFVFSNTSLSLHSLFFFKDLVLYR